MAQSLQEAEAKLLTDQRARNEVKKLSETRTSQLHCLHEESGGHNIYLSCAESLYTRI